MTFYFKKSFHTHGLNFVDYFLCPKCGFVCSKTHFDMKLEEWEKLNIDVHKLYNSMPKNSDNNPPPYFEQALMLYILMRFNIISKNNWLDWASGEGNLSVILNKCFSIQLNNFDKYINPNINQLNERDLVNKKFKVVISSALFEHVRSIETLNTLNHLVAKNGVLVIHTVVREEIPKDPEWFYLLPVHCAFHTNRSMQILMENWGYTCSIYCLESKTWVLFKCDPGKISKSVYEVNGFVKKEYLLFKERFMDYWK